MEFRTGRFEKKREISQGWGKEKSQKLERGTSRTQNKAGQVVPKYRKEIARSRMTSARKKEKKIGARNSLGHPREGVTDPKHIAVTMAGNLTR